VTKQFLDRLLIRGLCGHGVFTHQPRRNREK